MPDPDPNKPDRRPERSSGGDRGEGLSTADLAGRASEPRSFGAGADGEHAEHADSHPTPLFDPGEVDELRRDWTDIQAGFVDEPRAAVEHADQLVALTMKRLAEMFAKEREGLEGQWDRGDQVSTEDLRLALRRYRSFFDRLLAV
jgi:hypothetical protein